MKKEASEIDLIRLRKIKAIEKSFRKEEKGDSKTSTDEKEKEEQPRNEKVTRKLKFRDEEDKQGIIAVDNKGKKYKRSEKFELTGQGPQHEIIKEQKGLEFIKTGLEKLMEPRRSQRIKEKQIKKDMEKAKTTEPEILQIRKISQKEKEILAKKLDLKGRQENKNNWRKIKELDQKLNEQTLSKKKN